jgi:hypothetical protein
MSATQSCPISNELTNKQIKDLAQPLFSIITTFFEDEENRKGFEKWKQEKSADAQSSKYRSVSF